MSSGAQGAHWPRRIHYLAGHGPEYVLGIDTAAQLVAQADPRVAGMLEVLDAADAPTVLGSAQLIAGLLGAYLVVELRARGHRIGWDSARTAAMYELGARPEMQQSPPMLHARLARLAGTLADDLVALGLTEVYGFEQDEADHA